MKVDRRVGRWATTVKSDRDRSVLGFLAIYAKHEIFYRFKLSLEVHWLSISLGYYLPKAYLPLVRCSRLFSRPRSKLISLMKSRCVLLEFSDVVLFPVSVPVFRFRCSRFQRFPVARESESLYTIQSLLTTHQLHT